MSKKVIGAAYTMLDGKRHDADDDFFRVRALEAKFKCDDDFVDLCARHRRHRRQDRAEGHHQVPGDDERDVQDAALPQPHRCPVLPGQRFWRFNGGIHVVLTLVPPHRTYGPMTHGMVEPIYCGAWHPAANICTFCPGREYVTLQLLDGDAPHRQRRQGHGPARASSRRWTSRRPAARWSKTRRPDRCAADISKGPANAGPFRFTSGRTAARRRRPRCRGWPRRAGTR